jgi:hypothetical protein
MITPIRTDIPNPPPPPTFTLEGLTVEDMIFFAAMLGATNPRARRWITADDYTMMPGDGGYEQYQVFLDALEDAGVSNDRVRGASKRFRESGYSLPAMLTVAQESLR